MSNVPDQARRGPDEPSHAHTSAAVDPFAGLDDDGLEPTAPLPVVRGWTQAEIDAEIARFGDIPLYDPAGSGSASEPDPEPAPEPEATGVGGYDWLFSGHAPSPLTPLPVEATSGPPTQPLQPVPALPRVPAPATPTARHTPVTGPSATRPASTRPAATRPAARRGAKARRRRGERLLLTTLVLLTCLALGTAGTIFVQGLDGRAPVADQVPAGQVWDGEVAPVTGVLAQSTCVAPSGTDDGATVRYDAANAVDGDPATAWRCDDTTTPAISFTVPRDTQIAEVALVNGYVKSTGGVDQYPLNLRVLTARWTLPDGTVVEQQLVDGERDLQHLRIPVTSGGTITLQIVKSNSSGTNAVGRGSIVISEVAFFAPRP